MVGNVLARSRTPAGAIQAGTRGGVNDRRSVVLRPDELDLPNVCSKYR